MRFSRAHFLIPGFLLFLLGALMAISTGSELDPGRFALGYSILLTGHLSMHFSNDYFDREGDNHLMRTVFTGGSGVLQERPELATVGALLSAILLTASLLLAVVFMLVYSFPITFFLFVLGANLLALFYAAPPLRLAYRGLGEISTAIGVGLLMPGLGYLVGSGTIETLLLVFAIPLILYGFLFILTVELPDLEADIEAGKRNLVVIKGPDLAPGMSFAICLVGTSLLMLYHLLDLLSPLHILPFVLASLIPLLVSLKGFLRPPRRRESMVSHTKITLLSLISFLLVMDAYLLVQLHA